MARITLSAEQPVELQEAVGAFTGNWRGLSQPGMLGWGRGEGLSVAVHNLQPSRHRRHLVLKHHDRQAPLDAGTNHLAHEGQVDVQHLAVKESRANKGRLCVAAETSRSIVSQIK